MNKTLTTRPTDIKGTQAPCCTRKFNNLQKMDRCLERRKLPKQTHRENSAQPGT